MTDEVTVRRGVEGDFNEMMRLCMSATTENAYVDPDFMKLANEVYAGLTLQMGIVGVIGGTPGEKLEGAVLLRIGPVWYSHDLVLEEKAVFVDHEYRSAKGGRARKLVDWSKEKAEQLELPLAIGVLSNSRTEAKIRLYERMVGKPAGVYFLYNASTGMVDQGKAEGGT